MEIVHIYMAHWSTNLQTAFAAADLSAVPLIAWPFVLQRG